MSDWIKPASIVMLVTVLLIAPSLQDRLAEETTKYVEDNQSSHHGLPSDWVDNQVLCIYFPTEAPHSEFSLGVTMIDRNGDVIGTNENLNRTGACLGGFEGYSNGLDFMMSSTRMGHGHLSVGYDVGQWGAFVHTIGGLNADTLAGDFNGAYWHLDHNGAASMVGIGDLVMSEGDVIEWSIGTW